MSPAAGTLRSVWHGPDGLQRLARRVLQAHDDRVEGARRAQGGREELGVGIEVRELGAGGER